jgi:hypothetical protein
MHPVRELLDLGIAHADDRFAGRQVLAQLEWIRIGDLAIQSIRDDRGIERLRPVRQVRVGLRTGQVHVVQLPQRARLYCFVADQQE